MEQNKPLTTKDVINQGFAYFKGTCDNSIDSTLEPITKNILVLAEDENITIKEDKASMTIRRAILKKLMKKDRKLRTAYLKIRNTNQELIPEKLRLKHFDDEVVKLTKSYLTEKGNINSLHTLIAKKQQEFIGLEKPLITKILKAEEKVSQRLYTDCFFYLMIRTTLHDSIQRSFLTPKVNWIEPIQYY